MAIQLNQAEFDDVYWPSPNCSVSKKAGREILRLATKHNLSHTELSRHCEYTGVVNGKPICVSIFDRDALADLHALRIAIEQAA